MNVMTIDMNYYFKGSSNICVTLIKNDDGNLDLVSDYGERMIVASSGESLGKALCSLAAGEFA